MDNSKSIKGYEFRHATYSVAKDQKSDALVIKENIHYQDGTIEPSVRVVKDYKRDFWVTKEGYRNHTDKKEWEDINKCRKFTCTQLEMPKAVARALGKPIDSHMRQLSQSQYLYGCDVHISSIAKYNYLKRFPDCTSINASVAVLDIETDVVRGDMDILSIALTFKDRCVITATKAFIGSIVNPVEKIHKRFAELLGKYKDERKIDLIVHICDDPADCAIKVFEYAHQWKPDFIAIWNMSFDIPRIEKALLDAHIDPAQILSDPKVPIEYRQFNFREGPTDMVTASGVKKKLMPAERWHTVTCTSSFYFIDAMCLYKRIRVAEGNESSYSLDNILNAKLGIRKLKFDEVKETGLKWHVRMQTEYKIEYLIYNLFDCISMELLDEKTSDISKTFGVLADISDFSRFKSNPKRIVDDLHFFCLEEGYVIGTFSDNVADEKDELVINPSGIIITLPSHSISNEGLRVFKEYPNIVSTLRGNVADLDLSATYPTASKITNASKETTYAELAQIRDVSHEDRLMIGINLTAGMTNALEIAQVALKLPDTNTLLNHYRKKNLPTL